MIGNVFKLKLTAKSIVYAWGELSQPLRYFASIWSKNNGVLKFKNGLKLHHDGAGSLGLIHAISGQQTYGADFNDKVILDLGANRGYFACYAAQLGAKAIYAYEPIKKTYSLLQQNIELNQFSSAVKPHKLAVESKAREDFKMYHGDAAEDHSIHVVSDSYEQVSSTSLEEAVNQVLKKHSAIDLLKMNCECAEYDILLNTADEVFDDIRSIRMEYHNFEDPNGKSHHINDLHTRLTWLGYKREKMTDTGGVHGMAWYTKKA